MELIRGIHNIKAQHRGCVLTIGNFDGVHLGHQEVLSQVSKQAAVLGLPSVVMTFEPQPMELFARDRAPARLTRLRDKYVQLSKLDISRLLCVNFNQYFASLSAEAFIKDLLVDKLGVKFLVVGDDFCFGKGRTGNFAMLKEAGEKYGFEVVSTQSYCLNQLRVSSTEIRNALAADDLAASATMLGRDYSISGRVSHGRKLGRTIGFPTANIPLKRCVSPVSGVYVVEALDIDGVPVGGVANIGQRPTVNGVRQQLEVHFFDFKANLYGKQLEVRLLHKLRDEIKFESFDALKNQIELDAEAARVWLLQLKN
ncbi:MAG: bifunctional riboflavin kinase/FAD synthetase [Vibrio toranzoniae]|jgi:riboflavin kinase / FMN adenylyltransferase|uniref:Riboflavin biosynthesis protein n=1 Tax=Vibrio toranzoniae TaxID=1194427 RepID=A0A109DB91_9VIBR|nr:MULTISPECIES: bifunctional riboflavin kinase/FAD synthetase [Vibrio]KWU02291.1 bifunctional riboflavin kinase/FMN adenylyltransferase [Vibrio toranzoniae]MCG9558033.1 bifunctional riboflavin kinase/FAD synthetase [Vibrio kanaloae]MDA0145793.1 bifunctional riboflavin kinase/FAD synthetase [Vibrio sp. RW]NAZ45757.1 bifunctional riboflavin kinase/FAD synthetase [Vibrio toranzoniae]NAZ53420.1 bifunctional riboflavin kinase/FAD synthetase [Vibrio toranzoniae]